MSTECDLPPISGTRCRWIAAGAAWPVLALIGEARAKQAAAADRLDKHQHAPTQYQTGEHLPRGHGRTGLETRHALHHHSAIDVGAG